MPTRLVRTTALTVALLAATAAAAAAHPGFRPDEVPAGGPVEVELVVPHGCGSEEGGDAGSPTVEVAVRASDQLVLIPAATPGWAPFSDDQAAGWRDDGGATADEVVLSGTVEVDAPVGSTLDVAVFQACANGDSYRWAAGEGEDGDPAVRLAVVEGTPPPLPSPTTAPSPSPTATRSPTSPPSVAATESPTARSSPSPSPTPAASPTLARTPTPSASPTIAAADEGDGGSSGAAVAAIVAALVAISGGAWWVNRGGETSGEVEQ